MKSVVRFLVSTTAVSVVVSLVFTLLSLPVSLVMGKGVHFWKTFLFGAAGVFAAYLLICLIKTIVTMARIKRDPRFERAYFQAGMDWKTYKRLRDEKDAGAEDPKHN